MERTSGQSAWLVAERNRSGRSVAAFCRERGLRDSQFCAWKKRLRNAEAGQFVEVSPAEEPVRSSAAGNHAIEVRLAIEQSLKLAGCYALTTHFAHSSARRRLIAVRVLPPAAPHKMRFT